MRLLERSPDGGFRLTKDFVSGNIPPYAILSHTWGPDSEEVTFQDVTKSTGEDKAGYEKIRFCAAQAQRHGLQYFWIDTCCINKENNTELAEAINSMFRWYQDAVRCFVFLSDVPGPSRERGGLPPSQSWEPAFRASRWFTRGWTLQELLAPNTVHFFARDGALLGDKMSLKQLIHETTGIAVRALCGDPLTRFEIEERFRWAESRQTTREEDWAYSLLGIFGVFISPIYGEGKDNAVHRLRKEINDKLNSEGRSILQIGSSRRDKQDGQNGQTASVGHFLVPYTGNPGFIGRSIIVDQLKNQLVFGHTQANNTSQPRVALYGLGGIGKTQIALAFVYWLRQTRPEVSIFWVHASSTERFRQAYLSIAKECSIPGRDDPEIDVLSLVKRWLESKGCGQWMLVVDNADDAQLFSQPGNLGKWIPESAQGSVLITTRNKVAGSRLTRGRCLIEVRKMDEGESQQLLQKTLEADNLDPDNLSKLSSRLEHLPLALVQAAAFIQEMNIAVDEYLRLLEGSNQHLVDLLSEEFETVGRDSDTPRAVAQTWILSFEQMQQQNTFAAELLSLMSLFDRQAIPKVFLSSYSERQQRQEAREEIQLVKAQGVLKAFSFVTENKGHGFDMHRLVQLVTRNWLSKKGKIHHFAEQAIMVVSQSYPYGCFESREICAAYLPHAYAVLSLEGTGSRDEKLARASLLHRAAGFFLYQGQWKEAERFSAEAGELRQAELGADQPLTLVSMSNLALSYSNQGRWSEAEKLGVQVMETSKTKLGADHPYTLTIMSNLALTYSYQGRWLEAAKLFAQVMETRKTKLGPDHPSTLTTMNNLASTYIDQGRWPEAAKLIEQVMDTSKAKLGADHPFTLMTMNNLAVAWKNQGRYADALVLMEDCAQARRRVLGEEHPYTLTSLAYIANWR